MASGAMFTTPSTFGQVAVFLTGLGGFPRDTGLTTFANLRRSLFAGAPDVGPMPLAMAICQHRGFGATVPACRHTGDSRYSGS